MKKILILLFIFLSVNKSYAVDKCYVYYPANEKIVNTSYSTGGGDNEIVYLELDVLDKNGNWKKYIRKQWSASGFFGVSRYTMPTHIYFIKSKNLNNTVKMNCQ